MFAFTKNKLDNFKDGIIKKEVKINNKYKKMFRSV